MKTARDVDIGRFEQERALIERLRQFDRTKSEFISMLAHELKGPMTAISGFGQILEAQWEELDEERRTHILGIVNKEIGRLARLVDDLLDLSRMESGALRYEMGPVSIKDLVRTVLSVHTSLSRRHEITLDLPDALPPVQADGDRIRQVLMNLLTNALRHSPEGTVITVSARAVEDKWVQVSVADHGIGMKPEDLEHIFTKFVILDKPSWVPKGTGLGLYITKGIVEAHGGRIWVESEVGAGSTFHFTLESAAPPTR